MVFLLELYKRDHDPRGRKEFDCIKIPPTERLILLYIRFLNKSQRVRVDDDDELALLYTATSFLAYLSFS